MTPTLANARSFSTWAVSKARSRHDYDSHEHLVAEMLHEEFFSPVLDLIEANDLVHIRDAANEQAIIRIDWVNKSARRCGFSIIERIEERPIVPESGFTIKNRGPRGGFWSIINDAGEIVRSNMRTQDEAQRHLDILLAEKVAA